MDQIPPGRAAESLCAAIYDRVSVVRGRDFRSTDQQEMENRAACRGQGWDVVERYVDNDRSASRFSKKTRPDWKRLLDDLTVGRFDVLVLWEPSRGDRELEMWARLLNTCRRRGALIHITSHHRTYDVRIPREWRTLAEDGVDAAYESEKTSQRINRDMGISAAKGRPHGRLAFGYRRIHSPDTGKLVRQVVDDVPRLNVNAVNLCLVLALAGLPGCLLGPFGRRVMSSRVVDPAASLEWYTRTGELEEWARRVLAGVTLHRLERELRERGITTLTGGWWTRKELKRVLMSPLYVGVRIHKGQRVADGLWPPIFDEATHYALMARLSDPGRNVRKEPDGRLTHTREGKVVHLLSGIATCGVCGTALRVRMNSGYPSYQCFERTLIVDGKRYHVSRRERTVDAFITELVIARLSMPDAAEALVRDDDEVNRLRELLDTIAGLRLRRDQAADAYAAGDMELATLSRIEATLAPRIEAAEERARRIRLVPLLGDLISVDRGDVEAAWGRLGMDQCRDAITALLAKIEIMPVGRGNRNADLRESIKVTWRRSNEETAPIRESDQSRL
jgi:DNA invertase Pin-like site-specific DNA recombinase